MSYDLVVRNGLVVDGTGREAYRADVGIRGDRIAQIGRISERAARTIDADGRAVTPGFIDGHTHLDAQINWDPLGTSSCWHGVTSVVMGNCGFTLAPAREAERALLVRHLERAEDISADAMYAGIDWTWTTIGEYIEALSRLPMGINYATNVGHSALRIWAMGERAFEHAASDDEISVMERTVEEGVRAGALGLTTSRTSHHETSDDRPVASRLASWPEIVRLAGTLERLGAGPFESVGFLDPSDGDAGSTVDELRSRFRRLVVEGGIPFTFGVVGEDMDSQFAFINDAVESGGSAFGQTHCKGLSLVASFRTRLAFDRLPLWSTVRSEAWPQQRKLLSDPDMRRRLVEEAHAGDYGRAIGAELRTPDFDLMQVLIDPGAPNPSVAEMASSRGVDPVELMIDLALETDFDQCFAQFHIKESQDALLRAMTQPTSVMTFSDSGAHVSQIADSSIQSYLLSYWVRQRQDLTLERAVRMLSHDIASAWRIPDRGVLREGAFADLNVIDPAAVTPMLPTVVADVPAGGRRLVQRSRGFQATVVNGVPLLVDGEHTGALPGRLLRGASAAG